MTDSKSEKTMQYYKEHAESFVLGTLHADMSEARKRFQSYLSKGGRILDWGCGSGRDSLAFLAAGFEVEATDASKELCELAAGILGQEVRCESFEELKAEERNDGIWACASLLHMEKKNLPRVMAIACRALKRDGILYASFKYGEYEGERGGRYYTDLTEKSFAKVIEEIPALTILEQWITEDVRPDRNEQWLNVLLRKM